MGGAAAHLLPLWTAAITKGQLREADDIAQALRSQPLLWASIQTSKKQNLIPDFVDAATQAASRSQADDVAPALRLLAACIQNCDTALLLQRLTTWVLLLGEALRKATSKQATGKAGAAAANGDASSSPPPAAAAAAACAALAALYTRLQPLMELPGVRREATAGVSKVLQLLLPLLQPGDAAASDALQLLELLLQAAPASVRQQQAALGAELPRLLSKAAAAASGSGAGATAVVRDVLRRAARCLALLPRASGEAAAWSEAARGLLTSCHEVMDFLTLGLEGPPMDPNFRAALAPPGGSGQSLQQQQQHLGIMPLYPWESDGTGRSASEEAAATRASAGTGKSAQQRTAAALLGALLDALEALMTSSFQVAVPLPSYQILMLSSRLVSLDAGAVVAVGAVPSSASRFAELLQQQPALRVSGWRLLRQLLGAARAQLLPLQGTVARVVGEGLRATRLGASDALLERLAAERQALYLAASDVLSNGGLAAARVMAVDALGAVLVELYGMAPLAAGAAAAAQGGGKGGGADRGAKRQRTGGAAGDLGAFDPAASLAAAGTDAATRLAATAGANLDAQAAALRLLRSLLAAGGGALPCELRAHADLVAFHVAQSAAAAGARVVREPGVSGGGAGAALGIRAVQIAAYEALIASLLAPMGSRHPYLHQGLGLICSGRSDACPALRALCCDAAQRLEALLRPRTAPMVAMRQYVGVEVLPPLVRPRMWSVVDSELAVAQPVAAQQAGGQQQQEQQQQHNQQLGVGVGQEHKVPDAVNAGGQGAVGAPASASAAAVQQQPTQQEQEQQQQQTQMQTQAHAQMQPKQSAVESTRVGQPAAVRPGKEPEQPAQQGKVQTGRQHQQQQVQVQLQGEQGEQQPQHKLSPAAPASALATAQPAAAPAPAAFIGQESSDSEGELPDIDSGSASDDEEDDDE